MPRKCLIYFAIGLLQPQADFGALAPVEDVSDDESTGGSIPYDDSEKPKTTGGDEGDENNEEGEGEDGM